MVDGLFDLASDFGQKADASVPWGASKKVKLKVYNNMGKKVGSGSPAKATEAKTSKLA